MDGLKKGSWHFFWKSQILKVYAIREHIGCDFVFSKQILHDEVWSSCPVLQIFRCLVEHPAKAVSITDTVKILCIARLFPFPCHPNDTYNGKNA